MSVPEEIYRERMRRIPRPIAVLALRDPTIRGYIDAYATGALDLVTAVERAVIAVTEEKERLLAEVIRLTSYLPPPGVPLAPSPPPIVIHAAPGAGESVDR